MNISSQPLVNIITPVYNEAGYLAECIESILAQTYQNWVYSIVDNCSTDGSLEVALRYAAKDRRIQVHQNPQFLGAIQNHNAALQHITATSKYCKIVFGDDWIFPTCLEQMVALAEAHPSVGIVGAYALEGERVALSGLPYTSSVVSGHEICRRHLLDELYVFGSANAVLYRADLIRDRVPFYNEANIHADTEVCIALLKMCDFGFVHQVLTFTRVRSGSLTTLSDDLNTSMPGLLQLICGHGADYLTPEEHRARLARHVSGYYRFLGKSLMLGRNQKFWNYHIAELNKAGVGFSRMCVFKGALETIYGAAVKPKGAMNRLLHDRRRLRVTDRMKDLTATTSVVTTK